MIWSFLATVLLATRAMEVWNTVKPSEKKGRPPGTARASAGRQYEDTARLLYEKLGLFFHSRNFRWHRLEADLLFLFPDKQRYLLVEVRGRRTRRFDPSAYRLEPASLQSIDDALAPPAHGRPLAAMPPHSNSPEP